jgi:hypothetical protein
MNLSNITSIINKFLDLFNHQISLFPLTIKYTFFKFHDHFYISSNFPFFIFY